MKLLKLVPDNTNIDFMRWRNIALILSIIATVASLVLVGVRGLNLGIDFVGGQVVRATFAQPVNIEDLRGKVGRPERRRSQHPGIRRQQDLPDPPTRSPKAPILAANKVVTAGAGDGPQGISGRPGHRRRIRVWERSASELAWDGALAIAFSMLGIAIYIWFRFEWQFGVGALVTLFHDVSMVLGFFALTQLQVDLNYRRGFPGDRRILVERHGRDLRPDPREICENIARWRSSRCSTSR